MADVQSLIGGAVQTLVGLAVSTGFLLTLFIGFLVVAGFTKFRQTGRASLVVRNLVDRMDGERVQYLPNRDSGAPLLQLWYCSYSCHARRPQAAPLANRMDHHADLLEARAGDGPAGP